MSQFYSIANPAIFLAIVAFLLICVIYIMQNQIFMPLKRKHAHEKQELELKNMQLLSLFATNSPHPLIRFNSEGEILMINESGKRILSGTNLETKKLQQIFQESSDIDLEELILESKTRAFSSSVCNRNFDIIISGMGNLAFGHAYCTDITERTLYEERIRESENKLRELTLRLQDASETMKNAISMELHDGVCQTISSVKMTASQLEKYLGTDERGKILLAYVIGIAENSLQEAKNLAYDLTPKLLHEFGLIAGIQALMRQIQFTHPIRGNFQIIGKEIRLAHKMEINIYRIVQELLSNIVKHAQASFFSVQFIFSPGKLMLIVENDGPGFDVESKLKKGGLGLLDINERVSLFDGTITISSEPDKGTETIIELPINEDQANENV